MNWKVNNMNELLKGLRVKISTASRFYQEVQNPACEGAIECEIDLPEGWIGVDWDDGDWNSYQIDDLVFIDELESK
tara:strand:- start:228 stop:455 length:228 start_codon:yes stop_codon:yes gene_type:complete